MELVSEEHAFSSHEHKESDLSSNQDTSSKSSKKKVGDKNKKKIPWYSALYPTYKSRSDDFKRIFKDLPPEERLVVDYSCAIQRDILIHGRLYASQCYLCFYANIFRWETQVAIKWKDITSITKEKTALVIPNAILVHTKSEKHFFTSFATRDKTYLMLFRIWQHALMDQPMSVQEMWHWVHVSYGDELGLTSDDDEDYVSPLDDIRDSTLAPEEFLEESTQVQLGLPRSAARGRKEVEVKEMPEELTQDTHLVPTDSSDTTESDDEKLNPPVEDCRPATPVSCPIKHEGKMLLSDVYPISIDDLFTLIFTYNKFNMDLMEIMKYTDVDCPNWEENPSTGIKMRVNRLVVPVSQTVGPKSCQVTETQVMKAHKPGELYIVEVETVNAGVPYCDSFFIITHLCLTRLSATETTFNVYCQIKYRKSIWGIVKNFIEKNAWSGLEEFFKCLGKCLEVECIRRQSGPEGVVRCRLKRGRGSLHNTASSLLQVAATATPTIAHTPVCTVKHTHSHSYNELALWAILAVLSFLFILNLFLFYKLTTLEEVEKEPKLASIIDTRIFGEERSHEQWVALLQKQALQHHKEIKQWKTTLKTIVAVLKQAEDLISDLQNNIQSALSEKVVTALNPLYESNEPAMRNNNNEL